MFTLHRNICFRLNKNSCEMLNKNINSVKAVYQNFVCDYSIVVLYFLHKKVKKTKKKKADSTISKFHQYPNYASDAAAGNILY